MLGDWRRRRRLAKVKPGNGSALSPMRPWHPLYRSVFLLDPADDREEEYAVDVDFFDFDERIRLFRDGAEAAVATAPAAFPVPGGTIEVELTTFGLKRAHFVSAHGGERMLRPAPGTGEYLRARFDHRFPLVSRLIGWAAIAVLLIGLVFVLPTAVELVTSIPWITQWTGTITLPWSLPAWAVLPLTVGGILAALERALTLRNHWLIDADTWWLGD